MSDERFRFQFELLDKMSGPAKQAAQSVNMLNQALVQLNQVNLNVHSGAKASASGMESFITKMNSAIGVARSFVDVLSGVASGLANVTRGFVGAVLEQAKFHARARTSMDVLLRNEPGGGRREFSAAMRLAQVLPGTTEDVVKQRTALISAGFTDRGQRDRMTALLNDMLSLSPNADSGMQDRALLAFSQIRGKGHLERQDLRQILELNTGISQEDIFTQIARGKGIGGTQQQQVAAVDALISERRVSSAEFLSAMERADVAKTGMDLGGFAHKQGTGLLGQLSNFEETPDRLLLEWFNRQESTMSSGGMSAFVNFLTKFNDYFRAGTPTAERFMAVLDRLINGVFTALFGNDPTEILNKMVGVLERMTPAIIWLVGLFPQFVSWLAQGSPWLDKIFAVIDKLTPAFQLLGSIIMFVESCWAALFRMIAHWAEEMATNPIIKALIDGIMSSLPAVTRAIERVTGAVNGTFRTEMDMHSPSRVMHGFGEYIGEGLALGVESSHGRVAGTVSDLAQLFTPSRNISEFSNPGSPGTGAEQGASLTVNFNIPDTASSPQEIADAARPMLETAFAELLERMAIGAGVG